MGKESGGVARECLGVFGEIFPYVCPCCREQHREAPFCAFSGPFSGECCARSDVFHECLCCLTGKGRRSCVQVEALQAQEMRPEGGKARPEAAAGMVVSFPLKRRPGVCREWPGTVGKGYFPLLDALFPAGRRAGKGASCGLFPVGRWSGVLFFVPRSRSRSFPVCAGKRC